MATALVFNTTNGNGYTLAPGTGGDLLLPGARSRSSAAHTISASFWSQGDLTVNTASGTSLQFTGGFEIESGLIKNGAGLMSVIGNPTGYTSWSGNTTVNAGTLLLSGLNLNLNTNLTSIQAMTGGMVEYQNTTIVGGYILGPGTHTFMAGSTNSLHATTIYEGAIIQQNGPTTLSEVTNGGNFASNAPLTWNTGTNNLGAVFTVNSTATVNGLINEGTIVIPSGGVSINQHTNLADGGGGQIVINLGGKLNIDSLNEGIVLDLQDGLIVNNGIMTGTINVNYGGMVQGTESFGTINVFDGGMVDITPSASPHATSLALTEGSITGTGLSAMAATLTNATVNVPNPTDTFILTGNLSGLLDRSTRPARDWPILEGVNTYGVGTIIDGGKVEALNWLLHSRRELDRCCGRDVPFDPSVAGAPLAGNSAQVVSSDMTVVPEPGTLALLLAALVVGFGFWRSKKGT